MAAKIKLHVQGFNELRNSPEMLDALTEESGKVRDRAGAGFEAAVHKKSSRAIANVYTESAEAMVEEARHGTLSKALGG